MQRRSTIFGLLQLGIGAAILGLSGCSVTEKDRTFSPERATSRPYKIKGVWYYPQAHYEYSETGIASWYGPGFHGKKTANGEIFNENLPSAAHKTLPLPSVILVTNLDNGRMLKVKVNDRGPFVQGRILDLSKRAAELLGFYNTGTAKVKVDTLVPDSIALASLTARRRPVTEIRVAAVSRERVERKSLQNPGQQVAPKKATSLIHTKEPLSVSEVPLEGKVQTLDPAVVRTLPHTIYVQVGSFAHSTEAYKLQQRLMGLGRSYIRTEMVGKYKLYKVDVGPVSNVMEADRLLDQVLAKGYKNAKIVIE